MNEREIAICEAAARMFTRYGVKRTGMNDIALEAGVARQTLYNIFPNKDAVLFATIRLFMHRALKETERELEGCNDLRKQLGVVFEHVARRPYTMLHASPHAAEIIDGMSAESRKVIAECYEEYRSIIEKLLAPTKGNIRASGMTVHQLTDAILNFAIAAKHEAHDQAHLDELLRSLTAMTLRCAT
ncbi:MULTISPECIES: TetR/AcrR family transcriptional regulator [unclassified Bradyrhizobium]|uniref:TetR/AcrR family transcriptional regulator n=1 Tax=unclassified Bradyrhizobium TaxID=2631580 RepID=UPI0015C97149|nr:MULTISPECIES: TetR/AcrR family transcriptional regulator [unclassified Bradyrhizobium]MBB4260538.1 AcrR family transcriptional regulator [Bradyrhizobium sp. CIR3A]NYG46808.1 AcrR family transcriptional regulator [Bradyrhizobium sp. IAR9]